MEINRPLLDRIEKALRREQSLLTGVSGEIVSATTFLAQRQAEELSAKRRADAWPADREFEALPPEEQNRLVTGERDQLRDLERQQRAAGRQAVFARHVAAAQAAGADPNKAADRFARASAAVDRQALQQSFESAALARRRAEDQLVELEAERVQHGRRAGLLRATLAEADAWLRANGLLAEIAA